MLARKKRFYAPAENVSVDPRQEVKSLVLALTFIGIAAALLFGLPPKSGSPVVATETSARR